jgi:hypothetical protein
MELAMCKGDLSTADLILAIDMDDWEYRRRQKQLANAYRGEEYRGDVTPPRRAPITEAVLMLPAPDESGLALILRGLRKIFQPS